MKPALLTLLVAVTLTDTRASAAGKPVFQYDSGSIKIPVPTADEPKIKTFGPESIRSAAQYLDDGAHAWTREKTCIACHTTGAYMEERPSLSAFLGQPSEEVHTDFIKGIPDKPSEPKTSGSITYYPRADRAVWRTVGLAEWDKHVTSKLTEATIRSLADMLAQQSSHGGYLVTGSVEIPYVTTDFELTLHALRAIVAAPGWLAGLQDKELLPRVEKLKTFLRDAAPRNDYERVLLLRLASLMPKLVTAQRHQESLALLWSKQLPDGSWSTRSFSPTGEWSPHMTDKVIHFIDSQPDAASPGGDPYMTGLAITLLREDGIPSTDPRNARGIARLKANQRASGRWWMQSLYSGNYQFSTYIGTCQALKALAACGELPAARQ